MPYKEDEFGMIEQLKFDAGVECGILKNTNDKYFFIESSDSDITGNIRWNKHELKAFIDELLVLHSKMK